MHYLLKTEPTAYSFADLLREKDTDWTGVTNPQAVIPDAFMAYRQAKPETRAAIIAYLKGL